jgi:hypothetical protein
VFRGYTQSSQLLYTAEESGAGSLDADLLDAFAVRGFQHFLEWRGVNAYMNAVLSGRVETSPEERSFCQGLRNLISAQIRTLSLIARGPDALSQMSSQQRSRLQNAGLIPPRASDRES